MNLRSKRGEMGAGFPRSMVRAFMAEHSLNGYFAVSYARNM
jgi:hypothetical protein